MENALKQKPVWYPGGTKPPATRLCGQVGVDTRSGIIRKITQHARKVLECDRCTVFLIDDAHEFMEVYVTQDGVQQEDELGGIILLNEENRSFFLCPLFDHVDDHIGGGPLT